MKKLTAKSPIDRLCVPITFTLVLQSKGFSANPMDPCVMNKVVNGKQLTVVIFVDDIAYWLLAKMSQASPG